MISPPGRALLVCAALAISGPPALAQQTLNLSFGHMMIRGEGRAETDILSIEHNALAFDIRDFNGPTIGGEWLLPIGEFVEAGAGIALAKKTVSTVHVRAVNNNGTEIPRELGLRQMPIAFTARWLPLGQSYAVQPYLGGGLALIKWRFTEEGDFVIPSGMVFRDEAYAATGNATGPIVLLGLRVSRQSIALGFEGRYMRARGSFGDTFARVIDPDIDLGGWTIQATAGVRLFR
jgi:hypothetical protein